MKDENPNFEMIQCKCASNRYYSGTEAIQAGLACLNEQIMADQ